MMLCLGNLACTVVLASLASAFPSAAHLVKRDARETTEAPPDSADPGSWQYAISTYVTTYIVISTSIYSTSSSGNEDYFTTTYIATDLQTITTTISFYGTEPTTTAPPCQFSLGQTPCGTICCEAGQYCESVGSCRAVSGPCSNPCGFNGALCCAASETCRTDASGIAQCEPSGGTGSGGCSNPCGFYDQVCCATNEVCGTNANNEAICLPSNGPNEPSCPLSTTVYTTTSSYESTVLETITIVRTRVETGVETIIRTATFQPYPQLCLAELGQFQCGNICCLPGQICQSPGVCADQACASVPPNLNIITITELVTTTVPFATPVATSR